jgi:hypothetical protein
MGHPAFSHSQAEIESCSRVSHARLGIDFLFNLRKIRVPGFGLESSSTLAAVGMQ